MESNRPASPVALVLGGITNHILLIDRLHKRGYYVILIDYLDDPPAKAAADEHLKISTFDEQSIERVAIERQASLIINANLEHVNATAIRISERLGLPVPYSSEIAMNISDKYRMKSIMKSGDVPTTDFCCLSTFDEFNVGSLRFPLFVKPVDGSGSTAVNRATNLDELKACISIARDASSKCRVIVEEEALGEECSVYTFISNGIAHVLLTAQKLIEAGDGVSLTRCMATIAPAELGEVANREIQVAAQAIADAFGLVNCPMFMQIKVQDDHINVIEFAGRVAGGYSYKTISLATGFDIFEGTIDAFLGRSVSVPPARNASLYAICSILGCPATFGAIDGVDTLKNEGTLLDFLQVKNFGVRFSNGKANAQRAGFALIEAGNKKELLAKMKRCFEQLRVLDKCGKDITLENTSFQLLKKGADRDAD